MFFPPGGVIVELKELTMKNTELTLKNRLKVARVEKQISQDQLAEMVGVSRQTIGLIERGRGLNAKLALIICLVLDKKFEEIFYFD